MPSLAMASVIKQAFSGQFEAALCTLRNCVDRCPDKLWNTPVAELEFNQAAFHALFYADVYLGQNTQALREQEFHRQCAEAFADYEELEDRRQQNKYTRSFVNQYIEHCLNKARVVIAAETEASLAARCGFEWLEISRAELYIYNTRHLQHHAAQLSLRLRLNEDEFIGWIRNGWQSV